MSPGWTMEEISAMLGASTPDRVRRLEWAIEELVKAGILVPTGDGKLYLVHDSAGRVRVTDDALLKEVGTSQWETTPMTKFNEGTKVIVPGVVGKKIEVRGYTVLMAGGGSRTIQEENTGIWLYGGYHTITVCGIAWRTTQAGNGIVLGSDVADAFASVTYRYID